MALGITFIYSIMKMINWSMGEFYMIGSYVQYALIATLLGAGRWYLALPLAMASVFLPRPGRPARRSCARCSWAASSGATSTRRSSRSR